MIEFNTLRLGDHLLIKNNQFLAFNKPSGLPTQRDKSDAVSLLQLAERYAQHPLHLIHRIDQGASGVVLLAQHESAAEGLNYLMRERKVKRLYWAVVKNDGALPESGELQHYLQHLPRINKSIVVEAETPEALLADMQYSIIAKSEHYNLLEVQLTTGRHHQIRAQLAAVGAPIKGDLKYGFKRGNLDRSIHLHSRQLSFPHPVTGQNIEIVAPPPNEALWNAFMEQLEAGK